MAAAQPATAWRPAACLTVPSAARPAPALSCASLARPCGDVASPGAMLSAPSISKPHQAQQLRPHRPAVTCRFLPFGRKIFEAVDLGTASASVDSASREASSSTSACVFSPFSVFIALLLDSTGQAVDMDKACVLWSGLALQRKVAVYQALMPLCVQLNDEPTVPRLLPRLRAEMSGTSQAVIEQTIAECLSAPQHQAEQQGTAQGPAVSKPLLAAHQRIAADEANVTALDMTLRAAGLGRHDVRPTTPAPGPAGNTVSTSEAGVSLQWTAGAQRAPAGGWGEFVGKCRLAWDVFFPAKQQTLSPAGAMRARLQMVLVSDRSGLDLPTLMRIRNQSIAALAQSNGWEAMQELEMKVASSCGTSDKVLSLPLSQIPSPFMLRNADDYDYEYEDEDDYDEDDTHNVAEVAEAGPALVSSGQPLDDRAFPLDMRP